MGEDIHPPRNSRGFAAPAPPRNRRGLAAPARPGTGLTRRRFVFGAATTTVLGGAGAIAGGCGARAIPLRVLAVERLPRPPANGPITLELALSARRSQRDFSTQHLSELDISRLLWAAQGITADWGGRTAPSAGAMYPLELYLVTSATYRHYVPDGHRTELLADHDLRAEVAAAALHQQAVAAAALTLVITGVYARTVKKYGERGRRYVALEAGHAAQNVLLEAVALGLAAVPVGAFDDDRLARVLRLPSDHAPLYLVAVGHPVSGG